MILSIQPPARPAIDPYNDPIIKMINVATKAYKKGDPGADHDPDHEVAA